MIYRTEKLAGLHDMLVAVTRLAGQSTDFYIIQGLRTTEEQKVLFAKGATKTMNSRHLTGHAIDLAPAVNRELRWDWPLFYPMADAMKKAAGELGVDLVWGGDWPTFRDGPHFELSWSKYP